MRQFVYSGDYTHYRGYVFAYGKPTTVTDRGTINALLTNPAFKEFRHEEAKEAPETPVLDKDACPKCGRIVKQGRYMHIKHCHA